jgi:hypothetical protein
MLSSFKSPPSHASYNQKMNSLTTLVVISFSFPIVPLGPYVEKKSMIMNIYDTSKEKRVVSYQELTK